MSGLTFALTSLFGGDDGGSGTGAFVDLTGAPTDNTALANELNAKANAASPSFSGPMTSTGPTVSTANALAAFVIDVTKGLNTKSISADQTFTFSGAPGTANTAFALRVTNTDTAAHTIGIPSSIPEGQSSAVTSVVVPASSSIFLSWLYDGTNYNLFNLSAQGITLASKSTAYTAVATDANSGLLHPAADTTARIWTIPANASVPFAIGTTLTFVNQNAGGVVTIAITTDTMRLAGAGTTGRRTLAANGIATALKITSTEWIINGTGLT
jgi:hypothetical protein